MQRRVFLNRVVLKGVALLELLACEDETLLSWWDALLVLDLGLDVFNSVIRINIERDVLSSQCLHKDLHNKV